MINLHLRKMIWTEDEWPVLSPQRYAVIPQDSDITPDFITSSWEHITLTQVGEKNDSVVLTFSDDQTINETESWSLDGKTLFLTLPGRNEFTAHLMRL